ncbi:hypothetical protein [Pseudomonas cremoricolorata]|uniref:Orn/Lys/Arg family decarboxylase n=1 Tax=Pseudomonas cremoricolorata TaxID=157783 RepID=UPI0006767929|nr:hypothetical protein [Pseudomonas cremoricolorata]
MSVLIVHSAELVLPQWCDATGRVFDAPACLAEASALLLSEDDARHPGVADAVARWALPLFIVIGTEPARLQVPGAVHLSLPLRASDYPRIIASARAYEQQALPPLTRALAGLIAATTERYAGPGHRGGSALSQHPAGARFRRLLGRQVFEADLSQGTVENCALDWQAGLVHDAQRLVARVFGAEQTWFVLNGAATANRIVASALLRAGDLILMDRACHVSVFQGALLQSGALPVYLDTLHDARGILAGYRCGTLQEGRLRQAAAARSDAQGSRRRPFRLAVVQAVTRTGVLLDAAAWLARVGHLCDYVLFDAGCGGHEAFIDRLAHLSPLAAPVDDTSPGIIVTHSVHQQMAGLTTAAQIHKQDRHLRHLPRYCSAAVFSSACGQHASANLSCPPLMSLEINAAMFAAGEGQRLWQQALLSAQELCLAVSARCRLLRPLASAQAHAAVCEYLAVSGDEAQSQEPRLHYHDPCKVTLISDGAGQAVAIPAAVLVAYLHDHGFTVDRPELYSFTLVVTPFSDQAGLARLVDCLVAFEQHVQLQTDVLEVLPSLRRDCARYAGMSLTDLCSRLNGLMAVHGLGYLQAAIFSTDEQASYVCSPYHANQLFIGNATRWISLGEAPGCVAAEAVIALPSGCVCIAPGERWTSALLAYLEGIEALQAHYPQFAPQVQGVHSRRDDNGIRSVGVYVLD